MYLWFIDKKNHLTKKEKVVLISNEKIILLLIGLCVFVMIWQLHIFLDLEKAATTGRLSATVNYADICNLVKVRFQY